MADLIIKPSVGTDNKLIIQNQAGNAVLTTDNSGVTLGTVTAGNLSNSAIVYPDGHVLKITNYNPTRSPSSSYTSGTNVVASLSFTPLALTESLKIDFQQAFQRYGNNASGSASGKFGFTHNGTLLPNGATLVSDHDNDNYSNSFRRTVHQHFTFYIPVGHASASGARTISMDCRPTTGRYHYESDAGSWGVTGFTITEFRG